MTQQPDNLFRQKLENYPMQASNRAWSRIESNLDRTSRKVFWWRMAASFVLIAAAGALLWNNIMPESNTQAVTNTTVQQPSEITPEPSLIESTALAMNETKSSKEEKSKLNSRANAIKKSTATIKKIEVTPDLIEIDQEVMITALDVPEVQLHETVEIPAVTQSETGLYLVYTADEVNEKYLRKSSSEEATPSDKKSSRMQKLMAVANNLTDVETGIRDLRQIKDEIFALNFLERKNNN